MPRNQEEILSNNCISFKLRWLFHCVPLLLLHGGRNSTEMEHWNMRSRIPRVAMSGLAAGHVPCHKKEGLSYALLRDLNYWLAPFLGICCFGWSVASDTALFAEQIRPVWYLRCHGEWQWRHSRFANNKSKYLDDPNKVGDHWLRPLAYNHNRMYPMYKWVMTCYACSSYQRSELPGTF